LLGVAALLFVACAAATVAWSRSMTAAMAMPGGWALSMTWIRMPGQTWSGAATAFLIMWVAMMVAMMLPALIPLLARYHGAGYGTPGLAGLTALAGAGYFLVWTMFGAATYPVGVAVASVALRWPVAARCMPLATGVALLVAGGLQLTAWKRVHLRCCRECQPAWPPGLTSAARYGLSIGAHCALCCSGYMALLLVTGMSNIGLMALVATAITVERLAPWPERVARVAGVVVVAAGILAVARIFVAA
jgi:predicted metal-binding membrane protein